MNLSQKNVPKKQYPHLTYSFFLSKLKINKKKFISARQNFQSALKTFF